MCLAIYIKDLNIDEYLKINSTKELIILNN